METVLKGDTPGGRKNFFERHGTHSSQFHDNQKAVKDWIGKLREKCSEDEQSLDWIQKMVVSEPSARIDANDLFDEIVKSDKKE